MTWIWVPLFANTANSSGERSSELRISEPSKLYLIALTLLALSANVAQPMTTPESTPAIKPHSTMIAAIASNDRYSAMDRRNADVMSHW